MAKRLAVVASKTPDLTKLRAAKNVAMAEFSCGGCKNRTVTLSAIKAPYCGHCGSSKTKRVGAFASTILAKSDKVLSSVKCQTCKACNIMTDKTLAALGGQIGCVACGTQIQVAAMDDEEWPLDDENPTSVESDDEESETEKDEESDEDQTEESASDDEEEDEESDSEDDLEETEAGDDDEEDDDLSDDEEESEEAGDDEESEDDDLDTEEAEDEEFVDEAEDLEDEESEEADDFAMEETEAEDEESDEEEITDEDFNFDDESTAGDDEDEPELEEMTDDEDGVSESGDEESEEGEEVDLTDGIEEDAGDVEVNEPEAVPVLDLVESEVETKPEEDVELTFSVDQDAVHAFLNKKHVASLWKTKEIANLDIFGSEKYMNALNVAVASNGLRPTLKDYRFTLATVNVSKKVLASVAKKKTRAALASKISKTKGQYKEVIKQSLALAATGINRQYFKGINHAVKDRLISELTAVGIENAAFVVNSAYAETEDQHNQVLLSKALELAEKSDDYRNDLSEAMDNVSPTVATASLEAQRAKVTASLGKTFIPTVVQTQSKEVSSTQGGSSKVRQLAARGGSVFSRHN